MRATIRKYWRISGGIWPKLGWYPPNGTLDAPYFHLEHDFSELVRESKGGIEVWGKQL